jgi:hypothetical protein
MSNSNGGSRWRLWYVWLGLCVAVLCTGCDQPVLDGLNPNSGPPGTAVEVEGDNLAGASVYWDAGTAPEQVLTSSFLSARFFTVPLGALPGVHAVQLEGDGERSARTVNFTVTTGPVHPGPRLDHVTVSMFGINAGRAGMVLMAHGANFDVGSTIRVNGVVQDTFFSRLLRNPSTEATDKSTLGYPIHHYGTVWCALGDQTPGSTVNVRVANLDGAVSNTIAYRIAASRDELDSDGDGLLDRWEEQGFDADGDGDVDVDLPALGADPLHKDLFIEVDWMAAAAPNGNIWANIEDTFENAPVLNSDGSQGIAIHIDRGAGTGGGGGSIIPYAEFIRYDNNTPLAGHTYTNFHTQKAAHFDPARETIFRYFIFAWDHGYTTGSSGRSEGIPGRNVFVTLATWGADGSREDFQTGTFCHELGHSIGLRHGGSENTNSKDNYNSIMQYGNGWIMWMGQNNVYSPSQMGGIDTDCDQLDVDGVFTYSQGQRADLDESDLDERDGVCDCVDRDWNENGVIQASVAENLDAAAALDVIEDHADWPALQLAVP